MPRIRDKEAHDTAEAFIVYLLAMADVGGEHYAPDFRDCLHDEREWVVKELAALLSGED